MANYSILCILQFRLSSLSRVLSLLASFCPLDALSRLPFQLLVLEMEKEVPLALLVLFLLQYLL